MHDGEWLYLLVIVDDNGKHHFDSKDTEFPWKDDSIEIYFDGDNSQEPNYDEVDDRGIAVVLFDWDDGTANASINAEPKVFPTLNSLPLPAGLEFATGPLQGPTPPLLEAVSTLPPDVYEIALLISDLNIMLGHTFGFEVQVLDDDDGGDRDAKWGWHHPRGDSPDNDFTWRDPRFMGRLVLLP